MDFIGIDLHKTSSQVCILSGDGELTERRIKSTREAFNEVFADRPPARILVEASTESEWVAQHLESLGHEVIVADPNFAPMYTPPATRRSRPTSGTPAPCVKPAASAPIVPPTAPQSASAGYERSSSLGLP